MRDKYGLAPTSTCLKMLDDNCRLNREDGGLTRAKKETEYSRKKSLNSSQLKLTDFGDSHFKWLNS